MVERMRAGSVFVDISIDQGGCSETSRPTTHANPTYVESGVVHYGVTNMPGAVARTSTLALNNATLPGPDSTPLMVTLPIQPSPIPRDGGSSFRPSNVIAPPSQFNLRVGAGCEKSFLPT